MTSLPSEATGICHPSGDSELPSTDRNSLLTGLIHGLPLGAAERP